MPAQFPNPVKIGDAVTAWRLSDLMAFEATINGEESAVLSPADERYLRVTDVARRYGVSTVTVWRWNKSGQPGGRAERSTA